MIKFVTWNNIHEHGELWAEHHKMRHRIFVNRLKWSVPYSEGMEYDEFDNPSAVYLLATGDNGKLVSFARLIPTTKTYMAEKLWPEFFSNYSRPRTATIWEATRFGVDPTLPPAERRKASFEIVAGCQEFGVRNGLSAFILVMATPIIHKLMAETGCPYELLGAPKKMEGLRTGCALIQVSRSILAGVYLRTGIRSVIHAQLEAKAA